MDLDKLRDFCLSLKATSEGMPFGDNVLVFKVAGKMFALCGLDPFESVNLKCDPEKAVELREQYPAVQPGYHMNKQQWNTVMLDGSINDSLVLEWTKDSYDLIVAKMPKKLRVEFGL